MTETEKKKKEVEKKHREQGERIVADLIYSGQFAEAREQCTRFGLDYRRELWVNIM